jgi:5-methylcytosine-specific restriction endonuclease McrA
VAHPERVKALAIAWRTINREKSKTDSTEWRARNSDRNRATASLYRATHKEQRKAYLIAWRLAHQDKIRATKATYRAEHAERDKALLAKWHIDHPEAHKTYCHNRRAKQKESEGRLSSSIVEKLLSFQKNRCAVCRTSIKGKSYDLDHIMPLARGGKNKDQNVQILCSKCNGQKHAKDPIAFMQSRGFLL